MRNPFVRLAALLFAAPLLLSLGGCSHPKKVYVYRSVEACVQGGVFTAGYCRRTYAQASTVATKSAPKYKTQADCEKRWGKNACQSSGQPVKGDKQTATTVWLPIFAAWMVQPDQPKADPVPLYNDTRSSQPELYTPSGTRVASPAASGETEVSDSAISASEDVESTGQTVTSTAEEPSVSTPVEEAPVESAPVEEAPVEEAPVEVAPAE